MNILLELITLTSPAVCTFKVVNDDITLKTALFIFSNKPSHKNLLIRFTLTTIQNIQMILKDSLHYLVGLVERIRWFNGRCKEFILRIMFGCTGRSISHCREHRNTQENFKVIWFHLRHITTYSCQEICYW